MKTTEAQRKAVKKYHESLDEIKIRIPKGDKQIIADHAKSRCESLAGFLRRSIWETIERDNNNDINNSENVN